MSAKEKKKLAIGSSIKKILIYTGTIIFALLASYLLIKGTQYVETGVTIIVYNVAFFLILPIVSFFIISLYLYVLDRIIKQ